MRLGEHERGLEKPQSENDVSSERIKSSQLSQGCEILLPSCLTVVSHCKHTSIRTLMNAVNVRCIQQRQRLMTRMDESDSPPINLQQICDRFSAVNNQKRTPAQGSV